jgi:hypothetical protein
VLFERSRTDKFCMENLHRFCEGLESSQQDDLKRDFRSVYNKHEYGQRSVDDLCRHKQE